MSDITTEQDVEKKDPLQDLPDDVKTRISEIVGAAMEETKKSVTADMDRRVTKLAQERDEAFKTVEEFKKSQMADEERRKYEMEQREAELNSMKAEIELQKVTLKKEQLLTEAGLDKKLMKIIAGKDLETFRNNLEEYKELMKSDANKLVTERIGNANPTPGAGNAQPVKIEGNPFVEDGFNMTEAARLWNTERAEAEKLVSQARAAGKLSKRWTL
jgi:hypothetical protein